VRPEHRHPSLKIAAHSTLTHDYAKQSDQTTPDNSTKLRHIPRPFTYQDRRSRHSSRPRSFCRSMKSRTHQLVRTGRLGLDEWPSNSDIRLAVNEIHCLTDRLRKLFLMVGPLFRSPSRAVHANLQESQELWEPMPVTILVTREVTPSGGTARLLERGQSAQRRELGGELRILNSPDTPPRGSAHHPYQV